MIRKLTFFVLLLSWGFTAVHYGDLPEKIPTHFNAFGQPDAFGEKQNIWALPLIMSLIFGLLHWMQGRVNSTSEAKLLQWVNLSTLLLFATIQVETFLVALQRIQGLGKWFLPISMTGMLVPILYFAIKNNRTKE